MVLKSFIHILANSFAHVYQHKGETKKSVWQHVHGQRDTHSLQHHKLEGMDEVFFKRGLITAVLMVLGQYLNEGYCL